jgi:hypothetical protein
MVLRRPGGVGSVPVVVGVLGVLRGLLQPSGGGTSGSPEAWLPGTDREKCVHSYLGNCAQMS